MRRQSNQGFLLSVSTIFHFFPSCLMHILVCLRTIYICYIPPPLLRVNSVTELFCLVLNPNQFFLAVSMAIVLSVFSNLSAESRTSGPHITTVTVALMGPPRAQDTTCHIGPLPYRTLSSAQKLFNPCLRDKRRLPRSQSAPRSVSYFPPVPNKDVVPAFKLRLPSAQSWFR